MTSERRHRRSEDPLVALHYQLSSARARGELDAIVVADASGVVVAGAGSWPVCEELAAYAPLLAEGSWASMSDDVSSRVASLRKEVEVRALSVGGQEVLLCARRQRRTSEPGEGAKRDLDLAADGIARILNRAA
ncbi:MAG TPA: hypothetical protein VIF62_29765 [Labilithrix sp.]|jgi:hypothetical protein